MIRPDEHVVACGMTGSGKTELAKRYLLAYPNVLVLDSKGDFDWQVLGQPVPVIETLAEFKRLRAGRYVYRPTLRENNPEHADRFLQWAYDRQNTVVAIDETAALYPKGAGDLLPAHVAILTRGRSRRTALWSLTQRPHRIPLFCLSEASHYFCFRLNLVDDRKRMAGLMGPQVMEPPPGRHGFWYQHIEDMDPVLVPEGITL